MTHKPWIIAAVFCLVLQAGLVQGGQMAGISRVVYTSDAGTIVPQMVWHEQITITADLVVLSRGGLTPDTTVNVGDWEIPVDPQLTRALFDKLGVVDIDAITRVEPQIPPVGAGTEAYGVTYADGKEYSLVFDPGVTYTNADGIIGPIRGFIEGLPIPDQARERQLAK